MTKAAAIYQFWSSFGLPAYEENFVPSVDDALDFPYVTYNFVSDKFGNKVAMFGRLWYRTTSPTLLNAKEQEIIDHIGAFIVLDVDDGKIQIERGSPFSNFIDDPNDSMVKGKVINITVEYLTMN